MKRRRLGAVLIASVSLLYSLCYLSLTLDGFYAPTLYGLRHGPDERAILAPKGAFPFAWNPYAERPMTTYEEINDGALFWLRLKAVVFYPLYALDRRFWHRDQFGLHDADGLEGFRYPVKNYFDEETYSYRDYNPE